MPCWGPEWSPRIGVAWDVFGDARTALKFSTGKYLTPTTTALPNRVNPMALTTFALPWSDPNGDSIVQDHELDFNRLPANFGSRRLDDIDPNLVREWNVETSVSVERELTRNVSLSVGWVPPVLPRHPVHRHRLRGDVHLQPALGGAGLVPGGRGGQPAQRRGLQRVRPRQRGPRGAGGQPRHQPHRPHRRLQRDRGRAERAAAGRGTAHLQPDDAAQDHQRVRQPGRPERGSLLRPQRHEPLQRQPAGGRDGRLRRGSTSRTTSSSAATSRCPAGRSSAWC